MLGETTVLAIGDDDHHGGWHGADEIDTFAVHTTLRVQCQCHNIKYGIYQSMYEVEVDCNGNGGYIMYIIRDYNYNTTILRHYSSSSIKTVIIAHPVLLTGFLVVLHICDTFTYLIFDALSSV